MKKIITSTIFSTFGLALFVVPAFANTTHVSSQATLESAIAAANPGDTIVLDNGFNSISEIAVNKSITIDGNHQTISSTFSKTNTSNNAALGIIGNNGVVVKNLTVDGADSTALHGINIYVATNVLLDNVAVVNNGHNGIVVNGSTVTVNNVTTKNNGWGGIDVDLGSGVTAPAILTVNGYSSHSETYGKDIYIDDTTKNVSVVDTMSQYTYTDYGVTRVYTLKDSPTVKNDCKNGGWKRPAYSGHNFKNQGQCVSFAEHQGHQDRDQENESEHDSGHDSEHGSD